jgi:hypothetical protein
MTHYIYYNQHLAPSLDFSSTHEDAIGYHSHNEVTPVVLQRIILPCHCRDRFIILNETTRNSPLSTQNQQSSSKLSFVLSVE